jgi:predicted nucleic acid-binding protein
VGAVSDSSPLIFYARLGRLSLLRQFFGSVIVPVGVWHEVVVDGDDRAGADEVAGASRAGWIERRSLARPELARTLLVELGLGEAEAIALRQELGPTGPLLLDDREGRRRARELGVSVVGSAGLLIMAKDRGFISVVAPLLRELRHAGLYLSPALHHDVLRLAGERPLAD